MSRVARKQQDARRRLVAAAMRLIAAKGVEGLRIRELADAADVGFGSFYTHFATKDELVEAVVEEHLGALTEEVIALATEREDPAEVVAVAQRRFLRLAVEDRELAWLVVRLERGEALLERASVPRLGPVLERGVAAGRFPTLDVALLVTVTVGATLAVMRGILEGRLPPDADVEAARTLLRACGVADDEAQAIAAAAS